MTDKFFFNENMIMWAFRYALGRRTGAVTDVVDWLMQNWETLRTFTRNQIQDEIKDAFRIDRAGDHADIIQWQKILNIKEI